MKKLLLILIFAATQLCAQNLVNNPSFENISSCPNAASQLSLSIGWINPTQAGNADLFSTCGSGFVNLPNGATYYQLPRTGNNIAGIFCYSSPTLNGREYIQTQLTTSLSPVNYYLIKFYINSINFCRFATNNIGALLSVNQVSVTGSGNYIIYNTTALKKFNNPKISDTLNWVEISAIYQANGGEEYLTIGNFNNDSETDTTTFCHSCSQPSSYYFIDDVSVENITTPQWQYRDTTIYLGDSVLIGPAITGLNVDWFDMSSAFIKNDPGIYVKPIVTTSYQATETYNSAVYNHTVTVTVLLPTKTNEYEALQNSVKLFPNPTNGNVSLQFTYATKDDIEISISNITGKIVYENKLKLINAISHFDIDLKNGIYFVKIVNPNNQTLIKKLVIQQ